MTDKSALISDFVPSSYIPSSLFWTEYSALKWKNSGIIVLCKALWSNHKRIYIWYKKNLKIGLNTSGTHYLLQNEY